MEAKELIIVIPAYEPNQKLPELIDQLNNYFTAHKMIVVNDGSRNCTSIFDEVVKKENVELLVHEENRGKGAALKTAFQRIQAMEGSHVIVTADSDGQHKPEDIMRVYNFYKKYNHGIVLGSRKFDCEIPARSAFGNNCSRFLLRMCNGLNLNDTQTGLRAFGSDILPFLLRIPGNRYEYEMSMLTLAEQRSIDIHEISIETIYINNNEGSHFRPVRDFTRICNVILRYTLPGCISLLFMALSYYVFYTQLSIMDFSYSLNVCLSTMFSTLFGFILHLLMNVCGLFFGNPYVLRHKRKALLYLLGWLVLVALNSGLATVLSLFSNPGCSFGFSTALVLVVFLLQVILFARKSELHEE